MVIGWIVTANRAGGALADGWRADDSVEATGPRLSDAGASAPGRAVSRLLIAVVSVSVLLVTALHRSEMLIRPDNVLVHAIRDAALALVSLLLTWELLRRLVRRWGG